MPAADQARLGNTGLQALPASIAIIDRFGGIVLANQAWADFAQANGAGESVGVRVGANYLDVCRKAQIRSHDARRAIDGIEAVLGGAAQFSMEYPCHSPQQHRWFFMTVAPLISEGLIGAIISHVDITAVKEAENALLSADERFHVMAEATPSITFEAGPDGDTNTFSSSLWTAYTGQSAADALGAGWTAAIHPDDLTRAFVASDTAGDRVCRIRGRNGAYRWFLVRGNPKCDANGKILKWVGSCTDIDALVQERNHLQQAHALAERLILERTTALKASEQRFRMLIEMNATVAFTMDRDFRFTWLDRPDVGFGGQNGVGKTEYDHFTKESADRITDFYREVVQKGQRIRREMRVQSLFEPAPQDFDAVAEPLRDAEGRIVGIIVGATDVTERKKIAQLALAKTEAERANLAKSKFLAAASHDLRQPVQSLTLLLSVVKTQIADKPKARHAIEMAQASVTGLNALLTGILDIARLDAGVIEPVLTNVDLGALLVRLTQEYSARAVANGLALHYAPRAIRVRTDATLLERMARNLIENALRYTSRGGILVGVRRRGETARLDIIDTGIGIAADKQSEIFEEFLQLHNSARDSSHGLGLGLSIVSRLAQLLDIRVEVASQPGRGTRFSLYLCIDRTTPNDKGVTLPSLDNPGGRILVIEDNPEVRDALALMLEEWGYQTLIASSGEEAIRFAATDHWRLDAIVADHRLSAGLTGVATATEIARQAGRAIPTIIVTGDTAKGRLAEVHASGFAMMHKPVAAEELRQALATALRARPSFGPSGNIGARDVAPL